MKFPARRECSFDLDFLLSGLGHRDLCVSNIGDTPMTVRGETAFCLTRFAFKTNRLLLSGRTTSHSRACRRRVDNKNHDYREV